MAGSYLDFRDLLIDASGLSRVYFQPPSKLVYPCIVFQRDDKKDTHANNQIYNVMTRYRVTVIDPDPDSPIPGKISKMRYSSFSTHFVADNLNHDVYVIYY